MIFPQKHQVFIKKPENTEVLSVMQKGFGLLSLGFMFFFLTNTEDLCWKLFLTKYIGFPKKTTAMDKKIKKKKSLKC